MRPIRPTQNDPTQRFALSRQRPVPDGQEPAPPLAGAFSSDELPLPVQVPRAGTPGPALAAPRAADVRGAAQGGPARRSPAPPSSTTQLSTELTADPSEASEASNGSFTPDWTRLQTTLRDFHVQWATAQAAQPTHLYSPSGLDPREPEVGDVRPREGLLSPLYDAAVRRYLEARMVQLRALKGRLEPVLEDLEAKLEARSTVSAPPDAHEEHAVRALLRAASAVRGVLQREARAWSMLGARSQNMRAAAPYGAAVLDPFSLTPRRLTVGTAEGVEMVGRLADLTMRAQQDQALIVEDLTCSVTESVARLRNLLPGASPPRLSPSPTSSTGD